MAPLRSILLMILGMALFAVTDALIKYGADQVSLGSILFFFGVAGALFSTALAWQQGMSVFNRNFLHPTVILRNLSEAIGTFGITLALIFAELTIVSAIFQVAPLVVTLGAALFLGEYVGPRRWTATVIGFIGVLIILRPGGSSFDPILLLAVIGTIGMAGRDLATRTVPEHISTAALTVYGFLVVIPLGLIVSVVLGQPISYSAGDVPLLIVMLVTVIAAYLCVTASVRMAEASAVTPFRYSRMGFALLIGWIFFGERPDMWVYVGLTLIITAGLYTFWREAVTSQY